MCRLPSNDQVTLCLIVIAKIVNMGIDPSNHYLATGDMDGLVKIWNISNYCTSRQGYTTESPRKL